MNKRFAILQAIEKNNLMKKVSYLLVFSIVFLSCSDSLEQDKEISYKEIKEIQEYAVFENSNPTDMKFANQNTGYISGSYDSKLGVAKIAKTTDGGNTWKELPVSVGNRKTTIIRNIYAQTPDLIYATFTASDGNGEHEVCSSKNGGDSWTQIHDFPAGNLYFLSAKLAFVISYDGIMRSENGGATWKKVNDGGTNGLFFVNDKTAYAHQGYVSSGFAGGFFYSGQIIKTIDGGKSWKEIFSFDDYITDFVFTDDKIGYIFTFKNDVYKTTDGGNNWQLIKNLDGIGACYYSVATAKRNTPIYFASGSSVFRTIDDFKTVEKIYQINNQSVTIIKAERPSDDTIYFLTSEQNIIRITLQ
jgi:photosystem II stability/assembly factor-like uncharacterized protein